MNSVESLAGLLGHLANTISHMAGIGQTHYTGPTSLLTPTPVSNIQTGQDWTQGGNRYEAFDFPQGGGPSASYQQAPGYANASTVTLPNDQRASRYVMMQSPAQSGGFPYPGPGLTSAVGPGGPYSGQNIGGNAPSPSTPWFDFAMTPDRLSAAALAQNRISGNPMPSIQPGTVSYPSVQPAGNPWYWMFSDQYNFPTR